MALLNAADSVRLGLAVADKVYLGTALVWEGTPAELTSLIFPLTYDELDATNSLSLTRAGGAGPHVTPDGFEGDGYEARYTYAALPSFVNAGGPLTLAATVAAPMVRNNSPRTDVVALTKNTVNGAHRMGISIVTDTSDAVTGVVALVVGSSQQVLSRPGWRYQRRVPVLSANGGTVKPQGLLVLDDSTLLFSVHFSDTESRAYKMNLSNGAITGEFTFGLVTYRHVASFARRSNGEVWAGDYETGTLLQLDLDASFASGQASITKAIDCSVVQGFGAIEFATIAAQEYLLVGTYNTGDLSGYLYLYDVSLLAGASIGSNQEYRRYTIGRRVQGLAMREGALLVSRNSKYGGTVTGVVERFDLAGMVSSLATGAVVGGGTNPQYITGEWVAPSSYPEDLAVHPTTGEVFTSSEGAYTVADTAGFLAVWSSTLSTFGATNHYAIEFDGSQTVSVKINNQPFVDLNWVLDTTAAVLTIGGPPQQAPGFAAGYSWAKVSNVLLQDGALASGQYDTLTSGGYEPNTLAAYEVALVNPGAETGDTSGWTVESGGMAVRSANPPPLSGAWYFSGGAFVQSVSRQRVALSVVGVPTADVDSGATWVKLRWGQAAYSDQDPGGMGVRSLNGSNATISTVYSPLAWTLGGGGAGGPWYWMPRSASVSLPTGARSVDVLYNASGRTGGTNNDFYVDDVSAVVYSTAV